MPCTDGFDGVSHETTESTADHSNHEDSCTPFCICSCCGMLILNFSQTITFIPNVSNTQIASAISTYESHLNSYYVGTIWQPPQLA